MPKAKGRGQRARARNPQLPVTEAAEERFPFNPLLDLFPLPGCDSPLGEVGELTPAWAEQWLREDLYKWNDCVQLGYSVADRETREAFRALASDVHMVTELCLHVLRTGKAHRVERHDEGTWVETWLARVLTGRCAADGSHGGFEGAFDALAAFLAARLSAREQEAA